MYLFFKNYWRMYFRKTELNQERKRHWGPKKENPKQENVNDKSKSQNNCIVEKEEKAAQTRVELRPKREKSQRVGKTWSQ